MAISGGWGVPPGPEIHKSKWGLPEWAFKTSSALERSSSWATRLDVEAKDAVLVRRDALGISPVFVRSFDWGWAVAADLPVLLRLGSIPDAEPCALREYVFYDGWIGGPLPFANTFMVPADELWRLDLCSRIPVCEGRWTGGILTQPRSHLSPAAQKEEVATAIREALSGLSGEGPLGLFMSGGLDSTLLAALACEGDVPVTAFTCAVGEDKFDESVSASAIARHLNLELIQVQLDRRSFLAGLVDAIVNSGLPVGFPNHVGLALVAKVAGRAGVRLMLTGEGADELFGGYPRLIELRDRLREAPSEPKTRSVSGSDLEREIFLLRGLDDLARIGFGFPERLALASRLRMLLSEENDPLERELRIAWMTEFFQTLPLTLLRLHAASRYGSVQVAFPYLGRRVIQAGVASLPRLSTLERTKPVVRDLSAGRLPPQVLELPKSGFDIPLELWLPPLDEILGSGFEVVFGLSREPALSWARYAPASRDLRWATLNIEIWSRLFVLGHSVDAVKDWVTCFVYRKEEMQ
ncbi:MAG: asparagine synthase [Deltaproteobacteria bacterium]|nr:asparagine synthase [Deltaproteobacteria bacterium]